MIPLPLVAVAGNPNAGKSALFNALTGAEGNKPIWAGTVVPAEVKALTLHLHGLPPLTVELPPTVVEEAKMFD